MLLLPEVFELHMFGIGNKSEFLLLPIGNLQIQRLSYQKKLLVSVEELVIVEDIFSARYGMKINILEC